MSKNKKNGLEVLREALATLGQEPGVYRMVDAKDQVMYVGKAKHLKNRVSNYTNIEALPKRLQRMVMATVKLEVIITRSEAEALLVESNLIKKHRPRYNILMKDDKSYPYIHFSGDHDFPRISKYRGAQGKSGMYFGPFVSAGAVNDMLKMLQKAFLLRPCTDYVFKHRSRPCLQYQIKRCSAPCVDYISKDDYAETITSAKRFLKGDAKEIRDEFAAKMEAASEAMEFERAAQYRDRLQAITHIHEQQGQALSTLVDADLIALVRDGAHVCIQLFSYRGGSNFGNHTRFPKNTEEVSDAEVLEKFIAHHYQHVPVPKQLVLSYELDDPELVAEALKLSSGHKVDIIVPQRGEKLEALKLALDNTKNALARQLAGEEVQQELREQMAKLFGLDEAPRRIEVYDNSHISGTNAIGAMVVATPDGFDKKSYRTFNIKNTELTPGDDYAMMREVLMRRLKRLVALPRHHLNHASDSKVIQPVDSLRMDDVHSGNDEHMSLKSAETQPDLLLIDGGQGQLSAVLDVYEELGLTPDEVPVVAIAKGEDRNAGREWFFMPGQKPFQLPVNDALLHYLQRLRDEAHRFAIGTHRNKRSKAAVKSELDEMPGIGAKRKKALLQHFGSVRAIRGAGVDEIAKVEGVSEKLAQQIWNYLH